MGYLDLDTDLGFGVDDDFLAESLGFPPTPTSFLDEPDEDTPTPSEKLLIPSDINPWPARFPVELAVGIQSEDELLQKYGVTADQFSLFKNSLAFRRELAEAQKLVRDGGFTFATKCATIAEDWLPELDGYLHASHIPFAQKIDAFKTMAKLGRLEPKEEKAQQQANQVNIQINL